jgi:hypothetical protein
METPTKRAQEQGNFSQDKKLLRNKVLSIPIAQVAASDTVVLKFCFKELMQDVCSLSGRYFREVS